MALVTLGTAAQTTLQAVMWSQSISAADLAALAALIKIPAAQNPSQPVKPGAFVREGLLYLPSRFQPSPVRLENGDYIGVDATGWPIVISSGSAASASWVHT